MNLVYKTQTASRQEIYEHLVACDTFFVPPLSSRVDLYTYAHKIRERAVSYEAWSAETLVGMVNAYLNDTVGRTAYVTNVSVLKDYSGQGIASTLLAMCMERARADGFSRIKLEVSPHNCAAIRVYTKFGFKVMTTIGDNLSMVCEIDGVLNREGA